MRLAALELEWVGRLSAPLVAAALLLGSPSFAPAQTERLPKVGYLGFGVLFTAHSQPRSAATVPFSAVFPTDHGSRLCEINGLRPTASASPATVKRTVCVAFHWPLSNIVSILTIWDRGAHCHHALQGKAGRASYAGILPASRSRQL